MRLSFTIPDSGHNYSYSLLSYSDFQLIDHYGVIYLAIHKIHDHKYELCAFIYKSRHYIRPCYFNTKSKLYGAIQKLLQEEL